MSHVILFQHPADALADPEFVRAQEIIHALGGAIGVKADGTPVKHGRYFPIAFSGVNVAGQMGHSEYLVRKFMALLGYKEHADLNGTLQSFGNTQ